MFRMKNGLNIIYFSYTGSHKSFIIHYGLGGEIFKTILENLHCIKCNEINIFFEMHNRTFHVQGHTKDFGYIMGYASKRLVMYFQFCTMVFNAFQLC